MPEDTPTKKLIEVALPLVAINTEAAREKTIRKGHPSTLHLWWARRPLAACRAVLFGQLVDDPSSHPERFPTEESQDAERERLFEIVRKLVLWENTTNDAVFEEARTEIRKSCGDDLPFVLDPFAGGGSIPMEAQRLGLPVEARDLNPVAVLINKALIELPPTWSGQAPIHPDATSRTAWFGAQGLAEDVRHYAEWIRDEARKRVGGHYPQVRLPNGRMAQVIAWLWARTVRCPNPACRATAPLLNSFAVSKRKGKEAWLAPHVAADRRGVGFEVRLGKGCPPEGTVSRTGARCLVCESAIPLKYARAEGKAGRMGAQLLCTVAEGTRKRLYIGADDEQRRAAQVARPDDVPETRLSHNPRAITTPNYGIVEHWQLFTNRQLVTMTTFADLVDEARERVIADGGDADYADAVKTYLALCIGRLANRCSSQSFWHAGGEKVEQVFARTALPMIWVFAEANPFSSSSGNFMGQVDYLVAALANTPARGEAKAVQADASAFQVDRPVVVVTDPPYYDNVPYADLSDFFYVWLRRCLAGVYPELFGTMLVPKAEELIAEPARTGSWDAAARFFESGLRQVFGRIIASQAPDYPFTLFYAFKQAEDGKDGQRSSTGWETMLQGLLDAGATITGTWPVRTEQAGGLREVGRSSLASSIVLVCRPRLETAGITDLRGFVNALHAELPHALRDMQKGNIAPVDLAQAAIGPGMAVFSRYAKVIEPSGDSMPVRRALALTNEALDEVLAEQEGDFDAETRWALKWFEQYGYDEGPYGAAEVLFTATATSLDGVRRSGIVGSKPGKVWLLAREDLPDGWDPAKDDRVPVWEATMHLMKQLETGGEGAAADLLGRLGGVAETARELVYRLYSICEKRKWAKDAVAFNSLVTSWPEIGRRAARPGRGPAPVQSSML